MKKLLAVFLVVVAPFLYAGSAFAAPTAAANQFVALLRTLENQWNAAEATATPNAGTIEELVKAFGTYATAVGKLHVPAKFNVQREKVVETVTPMVQTLAQLEKILSKELNAADTRAIRQRKNQQNTLAGNLQTESNAAMPAITKLGVDLGVSKATLTKIFNG